MAQWSKISFDVRNTGLCPYSTLADGTLNWSFYSSTATSYASAGPVIATDGTIYFRDNSSLYAVNPDGSQKWSIIGLPSNNRMLPPSIGASGTIYVETGILGLQASIFAINPSGAIIWDYNATGKSLCPPIEYGGYVYFVTGGDSSPYSIPAYLWKLSNAGTLVTRWEIPSLSEQISQPNVDPSMAIDGFGYIYVASGRDLWTTKGASGSLRLIPGLPGLYNSPPTIDQFGNIYIGQFGYIYQVTPSEIITQLADISGSIGIMPAIVKTNDNIFYTPIAGADSRSGVHATSIGGTPVWFYPLLSMRSQIFVDRDGIIYGVSLNGTLYAFNPTGTLKWSCTPSANLDGTFSAPAMAQDGSIYYCARNNSTGKMGLFKVGLGPLSSSSDSSQSSGSTSSSSSIMDSPSSSSTSSLSLASLSSGSSPSSSSSTVCSPCGLTYYNDFKDLNSIANPILDTVSQMQFKGFMDRDWVQNQIDFDYFGYGLKKADNNKAAIFCRDASKLFSDGVGYVQMILSLPSRIINGVYEPLINDPTDLNEYILWGVNVGRFEISQPGLYAALTPRGIEFTVWTSNNKFTVIDDISNVAANTNVKIEFFWSTTPIRDTIDNTMGILINDVPVAIGDPPISPDSIAGLNFYALNTPFSYSNLNCTIRKMITYCAIPTFLLSYIASSSSSSSSSTSSGSSSSSSISSSSSTSSSSSSSTWVGTTSSSSSSSTWVGTTSSSSSTWIRSTSSSSSRSLSSRSSMSTKSSLSE